MVTNAITVSIKTDPEKLDQALTALQYKVSA